MRVIVVIGGIGSGKSTVSSALRELGAAFIDLDAVGHGILLRADVKADLVDAFGEGILGPDGEVVRSELAKSAFVSPAATEALNAATQPRIVAEALHLLDGFEAEGAPAAVVEISPYDGPEGRFGPLAARANAVVAVVAPVELRVKRASAKFPEADVRNRIARQATDDERRSWATHVIENAASLEDLRGEVGKLWDEVVR